MFEPYIEYELGFTFTNTITGLNDALVNILAVLWFCQHVPMLTIFLMDCTGLYSIAPAFFNMEGSEFAEESFITFT